MPQRRDTRRRFEQWVRNPHCEANTISAVAGLEMADVARAEGITPTMGQSPFAIARGTTFEASLFRDDAERLRTALIDAAVLESGASGLLDLRLRMAGGPVKSLDVALERTTDLLGAAAAAARDRAALPAIAAGATLAVPGMPVMLPDGILVIDALVLIPRPDGPVELHVGEIKSYPDRAGYTDPGDLAGIRAQAGVYRHALELVIEDRDLGRSLAVSEEGFFVLTRPGSNEPSVRAREDLRFQTARARRGFEALRRAARSLVPFDPADTDAGIAAVRGATTDYRPECLQFCDRAAACRARAEAVGDPAVLGDDVKTFLGVTALPRAIELLNGAKPANDSERDLVERVATARGETA